MDKYLVKFLSTTIFFFNAREIIMFDIINDSFSFFIIKVSFKGDLYIIILKMNEKTRI